MAVITIPYAPRPWQAKAHKEMKRFTVMVVHRRAGKTIFACNELLRKVTLCDKKRPQVAYVAPTRVQAKQVAWEELKTLSRHIPGTKINESELRIDLPNGGRIMVLGAENPDALRGLYLDYAVLDEVADMPRAVWSQVLRPALSDRQGGALFIGTPKGKNYFYKLYQHGLHSPEWMSLKLRYQETGALDPTEIDAMRAEMSEEEFAQELECSFTAAIRGAYYGKNMERAEREGRITRVAYDSTSTVYTAWDIGFDGTAVWYAQVINNEVRIIDCDIFIDKDIPFCINSVNGKSYVYEYHILPHDAVKRSILDKSKTVVGQFKSLGLKTRVCEKLPFLDGITSGRNLLDKAVIDGGRCEQGLEALRQYRAKFDERVGVLQQEPIHDEHSHPADAFRYLAVGLKPTRKRGNSQYLVQGSYNPYKVDLDILDSEWNPYEGV